MAHEKAEQRRAAARYPPLVHRSHNLVERAIALFLDKGDNLFNVVVQRRAATADRPGFVGSLVPPPLMPAHGGADADAEALPGLAPSRAIVDLLNNTFAQIR